LHSVNTSRHQIQRAPSMTQSINCLINTK